MIHTKVRMTKMQKYKQCNFTVEVLK